MVVMLIFFVYTSLVIFFSEVSTQKKSGFFKNFLERKFLMACSLIATMNFHIWSANFPCGHPVIINTTACCKLTLTDSSKSFCPLRNICHLLWLWYQITKKEISILDKIKGDSLGGNATSIENKVWNKLH